MSIHLDVLTNDIILLLISFLDCSDKKRCCYLNLRTKTLIFRYTKCYYNYYKDLYVCTSHSNNKPLVNVIQKLKQAQIKKESSGFIDIIHFNDMDEVKLANPYLSNLGVISHRCDQGKKIVFKVSNFRKEKNGRLHIYI